MTLERGSRATRLVCDANFAQRRDSAIVEVR